MAQGRGLQHRAWGEGARGREVRRADEIRQDRHRAPKGEKLHHPAASHLRCVYVPGKVSQFSKLFLFSPPGHLWLWCDCLLQRSNLQWCWCPTSTCCHHISGEQIFLLFSSTKILHLDYNHPGLSRHSSDPRPFWPAPHLHNRSRSHRLLYARPRHELPLPFQPLQPRTPLPGGRWSYLWPRCWSRPLHPDVLFVHPEEQKCRICNRPDLQSSQCPRPDEGETICTLLVLVQTLLCIYPMKAFPWLLDLFGIGGVMFLCSTMSILGALFSYFFIPPTRNKSIYELERMFIGSSKIEKTWRKTANQ